MIRAFKAELTRLLRRRVLVTIAIGVVIAATAGAAIVLAAAEPAARISSDGYTPTIESLSRAGGGTEVFRYVAAFWGTFVFVVFVGLFALDFSRGPTGPCCSANRIGCGSSPAGWRRSSPSPPASSRSPR